MWYREPLHSTPRFRWEGEQRGTTSARCGNSKRPSGDEPFQEGAHTAGYEGISLEATNTTITEEQHDVEASGGDDDGDDEGDAGSLEIWDEDGAHHSLPDSSEILAAGKEGAVDSGTTKLSPRAGEVDLEYEHLGCFPLLAEDGEDEVRIFVSVWNTPRHLKSSPA